MNNIPDELNGKKILVTGGAGFVGSHIVDRLSSQNDVIVLDNLSSGSQQNLAKSKDRIKFVKGDILDKALLKNLVKGVDYIFHLAAHASIIPSIKDPYLDMEVNIKGTLNLLEACRDSKIKRLVYAGSAACYGQAKYLPIDEDHPLSPESPYAVSKLAAEKYCFVYQKVHGIPVTVVRCFNIYGPRQSTSDYANAVSIFIGRLKKGEPINIYDDGKQTRDLIYVGDVAAGNILAAAQPGAVGEAFNISSGKATSVNQLVDTLRKVSGIQGKVTYLPARAGEIRHSRADIKKARKVLGFQPQTSLEEGLSLTWQELDK